MHMFRESKAPGSAVPQPEFRDFDPLNPTPIEPLSPVLRAVSIVHVVGAALLGLFLLDLAVRVTSDVAARDDRRVMVTAEMRLETDASSANAFWRRAPNQSAMLDR